MLNGLTQNISKLFFWTSALILIATVGFGIGIYSASKNNGLYYLVRGIWHDVRLVYTERDNLAGGKPIHFLQPSRKAGAGVTVNSLGNDGSLILLAGFFDGNNEIRLIRRDGTPVARWPLQFSRHFPKPAHLVTPPATDHNVDLHGALIEPDGSIVFNYEYSGAMKLDRCGRTLWTLPHPTHHSLTPAEGGGYWIPGRNNVTTADPTAFPPFTRLKSEVGNPGYDEDLILKVSEDGKIVKQASVPRILYENGLEPLMTAGGYPFLDNVTWDNELVHLNKIEELPRSMAAAFPGFEAGDLVLSLHKYNTILVVDPDDWKVKWHKTGPWRRQHDPKFHADGTISVYNNNIYHLEYDVNVRVKPGTPRVSNIVKVNPTTGKTEIVYGGKPGQEFLSISRGKHDPTPAGGFLVTEFDGGRVFEFDRNGKLVWEYINRYDDDYVLEMTSARLYPASYFSVTDWGCPGRTASN